MLIKYLDSDLEGPWTGHRPSLPFTIRTTGEWVAGGWQMPVEGELFLCRNGYHGTHSDSYGLLLWADEHMFEFEYADMNDTIYDPIEMKYCGREYRLLRKIVEWDESLATRFAAICIEHVRKEGELPELDEYLQVATWEEVPDDWRADAVNTLTKLRDERGYADTKEKVREYWLLTATLEMFIDVMDEKPWVRCVDNIASLEENMEAERTWQLATLKGMLKLED